MTLAFNIFPYLAQPDELLSTLASRGCVLAVRQYDGAALRFGPIDTRLRSLIEASLRASAASSDQFKHYDMDRVLGLLSSSAFSAKKFGFELFARMSPFTDDFIPYYEGMFTWTLELLSDDAAEKLAAWLATDPPGGTRYFFEVDLTAVLS